MELKGKSMETVRLNIRMYQQFCRPQHSPTHLHQEQLGAATLDCQVGEGLVPSQTVHSTDIAIHL